MSWTTLTFASLEVLSSTKMNQLQANFTALVQEASGIPTWTKATFTPGSAIVPIIINQDYNTYGITIDTESTGYSALDINGKYGAYIKQDITGGYGLRIDRVDGLDQAEANELVFIYEANSQSTQTVLKVTNIGTGLGMDIVQTGICNAYKYGLSVYSDSAQTTSELVNIQQDNASSTKSALLIQNDGTGYALKAISTYVGAAHECVLIHADGNNSNAIGMSVEVGTDDNSGTNYHINFADGDGTSVGGISSSGGTVSYNAFTGGHYADIPDYDEKKYIFGKIVCIKNIIESKYGKLKKDKGFKNIEIHQPYYEVELSKKSKDKRVFGVYVGKIDDKTFHIYGLGDGFIWVCKEGGNIENGDFITSSNMEGYGMKQDDDLMHNYTIAKSLEDIDWSKEKEDTKLIACTYHAS